MRTQLFYAAALGLALTVQPGVAQDQDGLLTLAASRGTPSNPSTMAEIKRSPVAVRKGANQKTFCPPGQAKKPGKGSAFQC